MMIVSKYRYLLVGLASLLCLCNVAAEEGPKAEFLNSKTAMTWDDRFDQLGLNGPSLALTANGIDIYVGGSFTMAGVLSVNNIAKWDGTSCSGVSIEYLPGAITQLNPLSGFLLSAMIPSIFSSANIVALDMIRD